MKKRLWIAILLLGVLLSGCGNNVNNSGSAPDSSSAAEKKTAVLYTNLTTGTESPDIKEHKWEYSGELTTQELAEGLSRLTGLDFIFVASVGKDKLVIDWAADSTLLANLDDRKQKEDFRFSDADSLRWFMMDSLWLTLTKNLKVEDLYYTMKGGQKLAFAELYPVREFPADLPYMGSAFFFAHADGKGGLIEGRGDLIDDNGQVIDGKGDLITMNEVEAMGLARKKLIERGQEELALVGDGEDSVKGEHAIIFQAGEKSADGKKFKALCRFAVTDRGAVYYTDNPEGTDWSLLDK